MRIVICLMVVMCTAFLAAAQNGTKLPPLDKSPMDMAYYPVNYPVLRIQPNKVTEPLIARVIYSRPSKSGRKVFGELVEDGKVWRLGANEATEIEFYRDVKIGGKTVKKGRYTMYALESPQKWTLILNKETDTWGAFKYDASKDIVRVVCSVTKTADITESFVMAFEKMSNISCVLNMAWDDVLVKLPINW